MAKNNSSKISITALDKLLKEVDISDITVHLCAWDEILDINVRRDVTLQEFCDMVEEATRNYFQYDEAGQEHYVAGISDFACDYVLLKHLTNLKTGDDVDGAKKQNERLYTLCVYTDLMNQIHEALPKKFVADFHEAVYDQVGFRKQQMLSNERNALNAAINQIDKATEAFTKFVAMFKDVDPASLLESVQKISSMDENSIAKAVVDARGDDFVAQRKAHLEVIK